jgi:lipoprotein-releasing system permease protein
MIGLKLSWRYFLHRRISILAVISVALCVFIVVVVMSIMNGLVQDFKEKNHQFIGDCVIRSQSLVGFPYAAQFVQQLQQQPFIAAASETVQGIGLMTSPGASWNIGIEYMGIDPQKYSRVTNFAKTLQYHADKPGEAFEPPYAQEKDGCVMGIDLILNRRPDTGQYDQPERPWPLRINLSSFPLTPKGGLAQAGLEMVGTKTFYYSDHSHSGLVRPDGRMIYIPIQQARVLSGMDTPVVRSSAIHIRFSDSIDVETGTEQVRRLWGDFVRSSQGKPYADMLDSVKVLTWRQDRREWIAPMEKEQVMLMLLFLMLGVVTVFIIFVVFYMIIGHKSRDLGVLKSIGMPSAAVAAVFLGFAGIVGVIGSILGIAGGSLFLWKINAMENWLYSHYGWRIWDRAIYAIDRIPDSVEWSVLLWVAVCAVGACLVGAMIPSLQASTQSPVRTLQISQT